MTGCIFLNRSYVRWQHAMVLDLKERYGVDKWCGVLYGKGAYDFVKNQKEINYEPLLVNDILGVKSDDEIVDDQFLNKKEEEYGHPFLWQEFINDRHISIDWPRQFYPRLNPNKSFYQIKQQFQIRIKEIEKWGINSNSGQSSQDLFKKNMEGAIETASNSDDTRESLELVYEYLLGFKKRS